VTAAHVAPAGVGLSVACFVLAHAVTAAERERTLARLRAGTIEEVGHERVEIDGRRTPFRASLQRVLAAASAGTAGFWLAGPVGALAGVVGSEAVRRAARSRRAGKSRDLLDEQLREAIVTVSAAVRAGLSIRRALEEAHRGSEPPLRDELASLVTRLRVGQPIDAALDAFATRIGSSDATLLATLLAVHRRTGGNLPALLDEVAGLVGQRAESRRQIRALTAQGRASGAVLAVLPIAFVGLLSGTSGDGLGAFYRTLPGSGLLGAGLLCELLGFAWINRIVQTDGGS
jgi:tight adherence protein B